MQADVWNILDSCAFFSQIHPDGKIATVSNIENELINRQSKQYFSNLKHKGLEIREPSPKSEIYVRKKAQETGDLDVLSEIDIKILSLGYELKGTIISDDFAIQNVSLYMKLNSISCNGKEIKELRKWKFKCSACNLVSNNKEKSCSVCGSEDIFRIKAK